MTRRITPAWVLQRPFLQWVGVRTRINTDGVWVHTPGQNENWRAIPSNRETNDQA